NEYHAWVFSVRSANKRISRSSRTSCLNQGWSSRGPDGARRQHAGQYRPADATGTLGPCLNLGQKATSRHPPTGGVARWGRLERSEGLSQKSGYVTGASNRTNAMARTRYQPDRSVGRTTQKNISETLHDIATDRKERGHATGR